MRDRCISILILLAYATVSFLLVVLGGLIKDRGYDAVFWVWDRRSLLDDATWLPFVIVAGTVALAWWLLRLRSNLRIYGLIELALALCVAFFSAKRFMQTMRDNVGSVSILLGLGSAAYLLIRGLDDIEKGSDEEYQKRRSSAGSATAITMPLKDDSNAPKTHGSRERPVGCWRVLAISLGFSLAFPVVEKLSLKNFRAGNENITLYEKMEHRILGQSKAQMVRDYSARVVWNNLLLGPMSFNDAQMTCHAMRTEGLGHLGRWRLPRASEVRGIIKECEERGFDSIPGPFFLNPTTQFWTGDEDTCFNFSRHFYGDNEYPRGDPRGDLRTFFDCAEGSGLDFRTDRSKNSVVCVRDFVREPL